MNQHRGAATHSLPRTSEEQAPTLRQTMPELNGMGSIGGRRGRLHFRSLKRLSLPRQAAAPRSAPNV